MATRTFKDYAESGEIPSIVFDKDAATPAHKEGRLGYDKDDKIHFVQNDIGGINLNVGEKQRMRVINKTGGPLGEGKAVRHDGVDPTTELPQVQYAIADSIATSRILGVIEAEILDGEEGIIATFGIVEGIDTSHIAQGLPAYLSDTIPGGFQDTPPSIVTQVGGVTASDAGSGKLFVKILNQISLPTLFGILQDIPDTYDLTTTYQDLNNYQIESSVTLDLDKINGTITVPNDGIYRGTFNISLVVPTLASTRSITVQAWDMTHSTELIAYAIPVPRDTTEVSRSMAVPFTVVSDSGIVMRIKADVSILGVTIPSVSYDIESISLT